MASMAASSQPIVADLRFAPAWQELASEGLWHFDVSAMSELHPATVCARKPLHAGWTILAQETDCIVLKHAHRPIYGRALLSRLSSHTYQLLPLATAIP